MLITSFELEKNSLCKIYCVKLVKFANKLHSYVNHSPSLNQIFRYNFAQNIIIFRTSIILLFIPNEI